MESENIISKKDKEIENLNGEITNLQRLNKKKPILIIANSEILKEKNEKIDKLNERIIELEKFNKKKPILVIPKVVEKIKIIKPNVKQEINAEKNILRVSAVINEVNPSLGKEFDEIKKILRT